MEVRQEIKGGGLGGEIRVKDECVSESGESETEKTGERKNRRKTRS